MMSRVESPAQDSPVAYRAPVGAPPVTTFGPRDDARPGRRTAVLATWFRQELVLLLREPVAVFFSLAFPVIIYVFIGIPYADERLDNGIRYIDVLFPGLIGTVAANLLLMGLPIYLAELRTRHTIRRYKALPLPGSILVLAILLSMLALVLAASCVIVAVIATQHGVLGSALSWQFLALLAGLMVWLSALGFLLGSLPMGSRTVQALSSALFFVMFFGSGAAVPLDSLPGALQSVLSWNPLKQWFDVLVGVYAGVGVSTTAWLKLLIAVPLTAVSVVLGLRFLRRT